MNELISIHHSPSPLFEQMLEENSTRALRWFRAADYMPDPDERRYCLERAVELDPTDGNAQTALLQMKLQLCAREKVAPAPLTIRPSLIRLIQALSAMPTLMISK